MKNLMSLMAAIAFTSAISAQRTCTVTTDCGSRTYNTDISITATSSSIDSVITSIIDQKTGEVIDTITCAGAGFVSCSDAVDPTPVTPTATPAPTRRPFVFPTRRPFVFPTSTPNRRGGVTRIRTTNIGGVTTTTVTKN